MTEIPGGPDFPGSPEESLFVKAAAAEVNKLIKANKVNRRVMALLVAIVAVLVYVVLAIHHDTVANCEAGNSYRAGQTQIWDHFVGLITEGNTKPSVILQATQFEGYIARVDAQRSCGWTFP